MQLSWGCPRRVWSHVLDHSPQATFFHTPAWAATVQAAGLAVPYPLLARWSDGRMALGVLGVRPAWRGLSRRAGLGLAGGYGGLVATAPLGEAEQGQVYRALWQRFGDCTGFSNPFGAPPPAGTGFTLSPAAPTRAIRLVPSRDGPSGAAGPDARAADRTAGVGLRLIEQPCPDDWAILGRLAAERAETPDGPAGWFACLQRHGGTALKMVQATLAGRPVGMLVVAIQGRIATVLHLAWDRRHDGHGVTTALVEGGLDACQARGLQWLDLRPATGGGVSATLAAAFGAETLPIWTCHHAPWPLRGLRLLKPRLVDDSLTG